MVSDSQQGIVTRSIKGWGLYCEKYRDVTYPSNDGGNQFLPVIKGRFDMHANRNNKMAYIELKNFDKNFPFSSIDEDKRHWSSLQEGMFHTSCWIFLILGGDPPNYSQLKYRPKRAWLFDMPIFYQIESHMDKIYGRKSLPYLASEAKEKLIRANNADAVNLLRGYELVWSKGIWTLPDSHFLRKVIFNEAK